MSEAVLRAYGLSAANLLGAGWESSVYALGTTQILRLPHPGPGVEGQLRARADFTATLPPLPFKVPQVRDVAMADGQLVVIEDRIEGRTMAQMLSNLSGPKRHVALDAYLAAAETMAKLTTPGQAYGDLLIEQPLRRARWADYLIARLERAVADEALAADVPGLAGIAARLAARLDALPDPEPCVVHGDIWPPNVMMNDALKVTGLIDFSFTTRIGDHVMDLAGAAHLLALNNPHATDDHAYLMRSIAARHGHDAMERIGLYAAWLAFYYAFHHEDKDTYHWCLALIRRFDAQGG